MQRIKCFATQRAFFAHALVNIRLPEIKKARDTKDNMVCVPMMRQLNSKLCCLKTE